MPLPRIALKRLVSLIARGVALLLIAVIVAGMVGLVWLHRPPALADVDTVAQPLVERVVDYQQRNDRYPPDLGSLGILGLPTIKGVELQYITDLDGKKYLFRLGDHAVNGYSFTWDGQKRTWKQE